MASRAGGVVGRCGVWGKVHTRVSGDKGTAFFGEHLMAKRELFRPGDQNVLTVNFSSAAQ